MLPPSARTCAARDARSTFPQSHVQWPPAAPAELRWAPWPCVEACTQCTIPLWVVRYAHCAWQGEVTQTDGQSRRSSHSRAVARLRARIWEEQALAERVRWRAAKHLPPSLRLPALLAERGPWLLVYFVQLAGLRIRRMPSSAGH